MPSGHSAGRIIARLHDGLGNQLFIYAAARSIAAQRRAELLLDGLSGFARDRKYGAICQLQNFAVAVPFAPARLCFTTKIGRWTRDIQNGLSERLPFPYRFSMKEKDFATLCSGARARSTIRLEGYWQSERYFAPVADEIRRELTVTSPLSRTSQDVLALIEGCESVGVHIRQRRGAHHAAGAAPPPQSVQLPFSYYERAVELVSQRVAKPVFFCFGDDPDWLRERWKFPYPAHFIGHNRSQETAYEDLALMTGCRHFIMGNSTFSWWGAWLSPLPDKFVVAPANEGRFKWASEADVIPAGWTAIKSE